MTDSKMRQQENEILALLDEVNLPPSLRQKTPVLLIERYSKLRLRFSHDECVEVCKYLVWNLRWVSLPLRAFLKPLPLIRSPLYFVLMSVGTLVTAPLWVAIQFLSPR